MALHRFSLFTLLLLLATFVLVPVRAEAPKTPTGKAPLEVLVQGFRATAGIAVDPDGTVYFTDRKEGRLWQRAPNGSLTILLERLEQPRGIVGVRTACSISSRTPSRNPRRGRGRRARC